VTVTASVAGLPSVRFTLTVKAEEGSGSSAQVPPRIRDGGILRGGNMTSTKEISPNGLITVQGENFAATGFSQQGKAQDGRLGTVLGSSCVKIGGQLAPLVYLTEKSANAIVPSVPVDTDVEIQVVRACGEAGELGSNAQTVTVRAATPEFGVTGTPVNGKAPAAAVDSAGKPVTASNPAKAGEKVTVYGFGFGATDPPVTPGVVPSTAAVTLLKAKVSLGLVDVPDGDVQYAGVAIGIAGAYQVVFRVPTGLPDGNYPLTLRLGDFVSPDGPYLPVKQ
jgi:uncharacterized protein (TIGR03437 family)